MDQSQSNGWKTKSNRELCIPIALLYLDALESAYSVQRLNRDQLNGRRGGKSGPHWDKSSPET